LIGAIADTQSNGQTQNDICRIIYFDAQGGCYPRGICRLSFVSVKQIATANIIRLSKSSSGA
jgi:hypothetical protein